MLQWEKYQAIFPIRHDRLQNFQIRYGWVRTVDEILRLLRGVYVLEDTSEIARRQDLQTKAPVGILISSRESWTS